MTDGERLYAHFGSHGLYCLDLDGGVKWEKRFGTMKTKADIVANWLPRYTGTPLAEFGKYILLVNFSNYVHLFAEWHKVPVRGEDLPMPNATADGISIINFGMGSSMAATVMDLLSATKPKAVLFLGKCGGVKHRAEIGDFILPIAAIRGEGTSGDYFPPDLIPCLAKRSASPLNSRGM